MTHAYATSNGLSALSGSAFSWVHAYSPVAAELAGVNDARLDTRLTSGPAATSPLDFRVDLGSAIAVVGLALLNHSLGGGGWTAPRLTITGADDNTFATNPVTAKAATTVALTRYGYIAKDTALMFPSVTKRWWRVRFDETSGTPSRQVSFGELFFLAAAPTSLSRLRAYGHGQGFEYLHNETTLSNGDVRRTKRGGPLPTKRFRFGDLTSAQRAELGVMHQATQGGALNLLWIDEYNSTASAASDAEQECMLGRVQPSLGWTEPDFNLFDVDGFELRSRGREIGA